MQVLTLAAMLTAILFISESAMAANHYIRSGATGANNGSDWSNAYTALPTTLVRGDTYYIAGGSYAGKTFDTPVSGTSVITIKGASVADHGIATGWSDTYSVENAQAVWTSQVTFSTSYWMFDGSVGPLWSRTPSQYGFLFSPMQYSILVSAANAITTNVVISHIAATAPSGDMEKLFVSTYSLKPTNYITISHSYLNGWQNAYVASSDGLTMDNWVFEYNMCLNGFSSPAHHGEWLNNNYGYMTNQTTRYNWFEGAQNGTGVIVANNNDNVDAKIYGNVFKDIAEGNGIITGTSAGNLVSPQVYNNTFINCTSGGWIGGNTTGTPVVYNNLIYNMDASASVTTDYNAYFQTTNTPSEAHGQIGSGSPFVNEPGNDLRLLAATSGGTILSSPYNMDLNGNVRGADGIWDRGALEFVSNSLPPSMLSAPQNLRIL
ncbi:MAG: hypothetical protein ACXWQA_13700 [Pseudobdellovibrionaceae bacterium]